MVAAGGALGVIASGLSVIGIVGVMAFPTLISIILQAELESTPRPPPEKTLAEYYTGRYYNNIHQKLMGLDWSLIPEDAPLEVPQDVFTIPTWKLKDYLSAYMLACEICARPEINANLANPEVIPEDLLGLWYMESNLCINGYIPDYEGTYCMLSVPPDEKDTTVGFLKQPMAFYAEQDPKKKGYTTAMYVSWVENPKLDFNLRAVYGNSYAQLAGLGVYVNSGTYNTLKNSGAEDFTTYASADSLAAMIKIGKLGPLDMYARPSGAFLPDALYTAALHMRMALDAFEPNLEHSIEGAFNNVNVGPLMPGKDPATIMAVRRALVKDIFKENNEHLTIGADNDSTGLEALTYMSMAMVDDIGAYPVDKLPPATVRGWMSAGSKNMYKMMYGEKTSMSTNPDALLSAQDGFIAQLESSGKDTIGKATRQTIFDLYKEQEDAKKSTDLFYGYITNQVGHVLVKAFETIAEKALTHVEWEYKKPVVPPAPGTDPTAPPTPGAPGDTSVCSGNPNCACHLVGKLWNNQIHPEYNIGTQSDCPGSILPMAGYPVAKHNSANITRGSSANHVNSIDFSDGNQPGAPIYAASDGIIVTIYPYDHPHHFRKWSEVPRPLGLTGLQQIGNTVVIQSSDGVARYQHMNSFAHIYAGMHVTAGTVIGYMGNTGYTVGGTGIHLHLEASSKLMAWRPGWCMNNTKFGYSLDKILVGLPEKDAGGHSVIS